MIALTGLALLADITGQYFARSSESMVWFIAVGGAGYGILSGASLLMVLVDMWRPAGEKGEKGTDPPVA